MISFFATLHAVEAAAPYCYGIIALVGVTLVVLLTMKAPLEHFRKNSNLQDVPLVLFAFAATVYAAVAAFLLFGLLIVVWRVIFLPSTGGEDAVNKFLFTVLRIAGLTTVLGAVIALPITISRLRLTREQTLTAGRSLFNEKINAALEDLYSRRQVTKAVAPMGSYEKHQDFWEDDIARRNAAIDRLERLAFEDKSFAPDIARMLAIYVRELSKENPPEPDPDPDPNPDSAADMNKLDNWAYGLKPKRTDMENAVQILGQLSGDKRLHKRGIHLSSLPLDLRNANLQGFDLRGLNFENALFQNAALQGANLEKAQLKGAKLVQAGLQRAELHEARLQGADLTLARLQSANLVKTRLQEAILKRAQLQGADLGDARLQGANLSEATLHSAFLSATQLKGANLRQAKLQKVPCPNAQLQGADLTNAQLRGAYFADAQLQGANLAHSGLDDATDLSGANLRGAALYWVNCTDVPQIADHLDDLFGDATVKLPEGVNAPEHWPKEELDRSAFYKAWREWQVEELGQDPDDPA